MKPSRPGRSRPAEAAGELGHSKLTDEIEGHVFAGDRPDRLHEVRQHRDVAYHDGECVRNEHPDRQGAGPDRASKARSSERRGFVMR